MDDVFGFDVSDEVLLKFGLGIGDKLDEQTVEKIATAEAMHRAHTIAVNYLSYRPRSSREVVDHLKKKGFAAELANKIVQHLAKQELVNDVEFARMFVRDKLKRKPIGKALMRRHLLEKGIPLHTIERVLKEYISEEDQQEAAAQLAAKRLQLAAASFAKLNPEKRKKRLLDYLLRRGFSSEIAIKTVRSVLARQSEVGLA